MRGPVLSSFAGCNSPLYRVLLGVKSTCGLPYIQTWANSLKLSCWDQEEEHPIDHMSYKSSILAPGMQDAVLFQYQNTLVYSLQLWLLVVVDQSLVMGKLQLWLKHLVKLPVMIHFFIWYRVHLVRALLGVVKQHAVVVLFSALPIFLFFRCRSDSVLAARTYDASVWNTSFPERVRTIPAWYADCRGARMESLYAQDASGEVITHFECCSEDLVQGVMKWRRQNLSLQPWKKWNDPHIDCKNLSGFEPDIFVGKFWHTHLNTKTYFRTQMSWLPENWHGDSWPLKGAPCKSSCSQLIMVQN